MYRCYIRIYVYRALQIDLLLAGFLSCLAEPAGVMTIIITTIINTTTNNNDNNNNNITIVIIITTTTTIIMMI